jgi:ADP-ribose pyrophosphatase YjhB (NUDIX family)
MWLITPQGFFSVVQKPSDAAAGMLTVRARVGADLDALRQTVLPQLGPTTEGEGTDYRYRARAPRGAVAAAFSAMVEQLDYSNFKSAVAKRQGQARAEVYHDVWHDLYRLQTDPAFKAKAAPKSPATPPKAGSYGGVVVNDQGEVLLVEPLNHFGGYVWTFPKGRPDAGETPAETVVREVREETGYGATVRGVLPTAYPGTTVSTAYFIMAPEGEAGSYLANETASVCWASFEEASSLIEKTKTATGRSRDLAVLAAAREALEAGVDGRWPQGFRSGTGQ